MAIILKKGRPRPVTAPGEFEITGEWKERLEPHRDRIARATGSVGRLMIDGHPSMTWLGTASICGPRLAFTASFAVNEGAEGAGEHTRVKNGMRFRLELVGGRELRVERACCSAIPYYRVALLELEADEPAIDPIPSASAVPEDLGGKQVVLIAYASNDPRNDPQVSRKIWPDGYDSLFIQPGHVTQIGQLGAEAPGLLQHDCSSVGGAGGGVLLDPQTGEALGMHSAGTYLRGNYAELLWRSRVIPWCGSTRSRFGPIRVRAGSACGRTRLSPLPPSCRLRRPSRSPVAGPLTWSRSSSAPPSTRTSSGRCSVRSPTSRSR